MRDTTWKFPAVEIDLSAVEANYAAICNLCASRGIRVAGVIKGAGGLQPVAQAMVRGGCVSLASSRLAQIKKLRGLAGLDAPDVSWGLLRIPGPGEIDEVVSVVDWSLQSDPAALDLLAAASSRAGRRHGVTLMLDLGDLREGWYDDESLLAEAIRVERSMPSLHLRGIGTNLGCYGSVLPSAKNLGRLVSVAQRIEHAIGRTLEVVSGGATSSLTALMNGAMPPGITELRIGEGALCAWDLPHFYGVTIPGITGNPFRLYAEIVELRSKPSYPEGELFIDAFGNKPVYEDRGIKTRALLAVGKRDIGSHEYVVPRDPRVRVVGSSSDHLICEIDGPSEDLAYGSILEFGLAYGGMLFACDHNPYVEIHYL